MYDLGTVINGRYCLEQLIGEGGMATVWRAIHMDLDRPVALKFAHLTGPGARETMERFLNEARVLASVRHRNVVDILDFGQTDQGHPYMAMELLEGESLGQMLCESSLPRVSDILAIGAATLSGLAAVHEAGVVHRDLKPENIFLVRDADGNFPKLIDFGISRLRSDDPDARTGQFTESGVIMATPEYMSPEQARGARDIDARADLYSMGVILYEALTGRLPSNASNIGDLIVEVTTKDPPELVALRPELGRPISDVVKRALAKDRNERFQSARGMRRALLDALRETAESSDTWARMVASRPTPASVDRRKTATRENPLPVRAHAPAAPPEKAPSVPESVAVQVHGHAFGGAPTPIQGARADDTPLLPTAVRAQKLPEPSQPVTGAGPAYWFIAGILVAVAIGSGLFLDRLGPARRRDASATDFTRAETDLPLVRVLLDGVPPDGRIVLDGREVTGPELQMPQDDGIRLIEVFAPGRVPWRLGHVCSRDAQYLVRLDPLAVATP